MAAVFSAAGVSLTLWGLQGGTREVGRVQSKYTRAVHPQSIPDRLPPTHPSPCKAQAASPGVRRGSGLSPGAGRCLFFSG